MSKKASSEAESARKKTMITESSRTPPPAIRADRGAGGEQADDARRRSPTIRIRIWVSRLPKQAAEVEFAQVVGVVDLARGRWGVRPTEAARWGEAPPGAVSTPAARARADRSRAEIYSPPAVVSGREADRCVQCGLQSRARSRPRSQLLGSGRIFRSSKRISAAEEGRVAIPSDGASAISRPEVCCKVGLCGLAWAPS